MISSIISRLVILVFGTLYPAYASYKAVRTKNLKEYVKWMMYWIVFALFTCTETFTDVFLSWFPFYYEVKIVIVLWLLSPATKGSSFLYRKFVHPALCRREQEIDEYIAKAKDQGYHTVLNLGTKGVNYATTVIMQTAIKGGGGLVQQIRKSYSLSDLSECDPRDEGGRDEADDVMTEPQVIRRTAARSGYNTRRSASESNTRSAIYFSEIDVEVRSNRAGRADEPDFSHIKSSEDISSGYSSADNSAASLSRTASAGGARARLAGAPRAALTAIKRPPAAEGSEVIIEELGDDDPFDYTTMPALLNVPSPFYISDTDPPFIYQYVGNQVKILQVLDSSKKLDLNIINPNPRDQCKTNDTNSNVDDEEFADAIKDEVDTKVNENDVAASIPSDVKDQNTKELRSNNVELEIPKSSSVENTQISVSPMEIQYPSVEKTVDIDSGVMIPENKKEIGNSDKIEEKSPKSENKEIKIATKDDVVESTSIDTSVNENDSTESDDEASFGTPEDSPKSKRKSPRGKYGKGKAPPPPKIQKPDDGEPTKEQEKPDEITFVSTSQESLAEYINTLPNTNFKEHSPLKSLQVVNPIYEKKRRHKSKSPNRLQKSSSSAIGKLLQLPGKLAFWHKNDKNRSDRKSVSSDDGSRRSSTVEPSTESFQSCTELNTIMNDATSEVTNAEIIATQAVERSEDQISFKDASDLESEAITHDIMEKSDALQKLIEAKIESHPEYKYVSDENEIQSTSKSTDV